MPTASGGKPPPRSGVSVPYTPLPAHGSPLVRVRLNGTVDGTFLIDVGSRDSLLTDTVATRLGLAPVPAAQRRPPPPVRQQTDSVTVARVQMGGLMLRNKRFLVIPASRLSFLPGRPVDGVLGTGAMAAWAVLFDHRRRRMTVWASGGLSARDLGRAGFGGAFVVPTLREGDGGTLLIPARFTNGAVSRRGDLLLDLGTSHTMISNRLAKQLSLQPPGAQRRATASAGLPLVIMGRVRELRLGNLVLRDRLVGYCTDATFHNTPVVGTDVLSRYRVLIDYPRRTLYLKPVVADRHPPGRNVHRRPVLRHGREQV